MKSLFQWEKILIIYLIILYCSGAVSRNMSYLDLLDLKTRCFFLEKLKCKDSLSSFGTKTPSVVFGTGSASQDLGATNADP